MFVLDSEFVNCFGMDKILRRFSLHLRVEWMPAGNRKGGKWFCLSGLRNDHYLSEKNSTDSWLRLRSLSCHQFP